MINLLSTVSIILLFNLGIFHFFEFLKNKINVFDYPDDKKKLHSHPVPLMGGWIFMLNLIFFLFLFYMDIIYLSYIEMNIIICSSVFLLTGILDDKYNLSPYTKFLTLTIILLVFFFFTDKIILIHREVSRHTNKVMSMISATNVIEFLYLKKILTSLPKCIHDKARYKCINSYGLNLNREFSKNFGKNKIISNKQNYSKSLENAKIIVTLYLSTPTLEALKLNVPTLILLPKNFLLYEKRFNKILYNLKKNKIIFDNPDKMSKHIGKIWNNVNDWWLSKNVQKSKNLYLNNFLYFKANNEVEREYIKKLKDI